MTDIFVRSYPRRYTKCRIDDELHTRLRVELALNEWAEEFPRLFDAPALQQIESEDKEQAERIAESF